MEQNTSWQKPAVILIAFLLVVSLASLFYLFFPKTGTDYVADIYQNGVLIKTIRLNGIQETETFTIEGENNCINKVEVQPGRIAIISADCPDQICVHQGFISDSRLPITCLPNRLVIQLRPAREDTAKDNTLDVITY